jgi:hypothetical protein
MNAYRTYLSCVCFWTVIEKVAKGALVVSKNFHETLELPHCVQSVGKAGGSHRAKHSVSINAVDESSGASRSTKSSVVWIGPQPCSVPAWQNITLIDSIVHEGGEAAASDKKVDTPRKAARRKAMMNSC